MINHGKWRKKLSRDVGMEVIRQEGRKNRKRSNRKERKDGGEV